MKVSILIPTFNRGYILGAAIKSALGQTFRDFEIVVVDDGSTDHTADTVQELSNPLVRYIRHEKNRGCSAAYNTAISAARGEYLAFLDSDDLWMPSYLERQVSFLAKDPGVGAVFSDLEIVNGPTTIPSLISLMKSFPKLLVGLKPGEEIVIGRREMYLCLLEEVPIKPSALVLRRELCLQSGLFNESWPSGTDWDLLLRLSHLSSFGYINLPLAIQKWSPDATHRIHWEQDKIFLLGLFLEEKRKLETASDKEGLGAVNRGLLIHYSNLAYVYLYSRRRRMSISTYLKGYRETKDFSMLRGAASALLPIQSRDAVKKVYRRVVRTNTCTAA